MGETTAITGQGIGQALPRQEDIRLLTGRGRYSDDVNLEGQAYAILVRSPHAHAVIRSIDVADAANSAGVLAVLTGRDVLADGLRPIPHAVWAVHPAELPLPNTDGSTAFVTPHHLLANDKVRFVGDPVAMVVAESITAAKDAAEKVQVEYDALPSVTETFAAAEPHSPPVWEQAKSNVCLDSEVGDRQASDQIFASARHVVGLRTWVQRVTGVPMEPRAAVGEYDPQTGKTTLHAGSGSSVRQRHDLAAIFNISPNVIRVVMHDVGGNFGTRGGFNAEFGLVVWAARRLRRPVKWTSDRSEYFLADFQARDLGVYAELALDEAGNFLAMRGSNISNVGAYTASFSVLQKGVEIMTSIYHVPVVHFRARAVTSNTASTRPYRSAGRPELMFVMERLIDLAAQHCGFDRVALRRRNLIRAAALPYRNPFGMVYDNGDYHQVMEQALELGDWSGFSARQADAKARGKRRGIGVSNYIDTATGVPRERAEVTVRPEGYVTIAIGTVSNGQGHETSYGQLVNEWLGVPVASVRLVMGDTDQVQIGGGSHSGRSMRLASIVIWNAAKDIIAKGSQIAAHLLQCDMSDVLFDKGEFKAGGHRRIHLFEVAKAAASDRLPEQLRGPLSAVSDETVNAAAYPFGCHVCEVEVDPDTGTLQIIKYTAVDDVGRAVNPLIVHGQTHGGIAQGVGQALWEHCRYDAESGQLLSASFMDYAMPRAHNLPSFTTQISEIPSSTHPLGIRPGGEGGTTPALAVVVNAVVDALADFGVDHLEMPVTPERVWQAIQNAKARSGPPPASIAPGRYGGFVPRSPLSMGKELS